MIHLISHDALCFLLIFLPPSDHVALLPTVIEQPCAYPPPYYTEALSTALNEVEQALKQLRAAAKHRQLRTVLSMQAALAEALAMAGNDHEQGVHMPCFFDTPESFDLLSIEAV